MPLDTLAEAEREHILAALAEAGWVLGGPKGAAARLGTKRSTLHWKMKCSGLRGPTSASPLALARTGWRAQVGAFTLRGCLSRHARSASLAS